jgi:PAS domain S-box-containing protein
MGETFRVLHVDDDAAFLELAAEYLRRADDRLRIVSETSARDALDCLDGGPDVDAIVSDYQMPAMDGLDFLDRVRDDHPDLPFILFTGQGSEAIASEAIARGVTDYLQKGVGTDQYTVLANRVTNAIERQRVTAELKRREAHLRQAQSVATLGSWWTDIESDELHWSDEVYEIFELAERDGPLDHEQFLSYVHPDDRSFVEEKWCAALDGHPYDIEHRIVVDGETKWVREQAELTFEDGTPVRATGVVQDITDRKERQRRHRETNRRLQAVLDTVDAAIFVKDADGTYRLFNDAAREMLGIDGDTDVTGLTADDLFPEAVAEGFRAADRRVLDTGEAVRTEETVPRPDGTYTHLTIKSPIFDDGGEPSGICAVSTDITDRVEARQELERQNERLDELAQVVSHDLDAPLTLLAGALDRAEETGDPEQFDRCRRAIDRIERLVDDMSTVVAAEGRVVDPAPIDLAALCRYCWSTNDLDTDAATVRIETERTILADDRRLRSLVENLFRNCVDRPQSGVRERLHDRSGRHRAGTGDRSTGRRGPRLERVPDRERRRRRAVRGQRRRSRGRE